jgi:hypothetical protein
MCLSSLLQILEKPLQPQEVGDADNWPTIERRLGTGLPEDFKGFIHSFGTGTIDGFLVVFNPFSLNRYANLLERGRAELEAFATSKKQFPQYYMHEVYPSQGGILPFGSTDNGDVIYWKTAGTPDEWSVVAYESRGPKCFEFNGNMTEFLRGVLTRTVECDVFPRSFPSDRPIFKPIKKPKA